MIKMFACDKVQIRNVTRMASDYCKRNRNNFGDRYGAFLTQLAHDLTTMWFNHKDAIAEGRATLWVSLNDDDPLKVSFGMEFHKDKSEKKC